MVKRYAFISLCCCVAILLCGGALAQHGGYDYLIQFGGGINGAQHKAILGAVNDQDPKAAISITVLDQQAKVRSTVRLSRSQMAAELAPYGLTVDFLTGDQPTTEGDRSNTLPFPKYIDTGDPVADSTAFAAAKAAWLLAHPSGTADREAVRHLATPAQP